MNFIDKLKNFAEGCELSGEKIIIKNGIHDIIGFIKDNYNYNLLKSITAVDLGEEVELIYNLFSTEDEETVLISTKVKSETETISDIYESAIADEREIYDMFGINFLGHDDLKRLYMPENWDGYPLKKDYVQDDTRLAWNDNSDEV